MRLDSYLPATPLRPFVKGYLIVECPEAVLNTMLPDTSLIMGFRYQGITRYIAPAAESALPFAVVAGLRKTVQLMQDGHNTGNLLVIFQPAAASVFFREPLHEIFGEILPLKEMRGFGEMSEVEDKLCSACTDDERIHTMNRFLLSKLPVARACPLIARAMEIIQSRKGHIRVEELSRQLFISIDAFEKRFRSVVGATPKQVCNIVRMKAIIRQLPRSDLLDAALEGGYYDQAHFSKAFKLFTGQTPSAFLRNQ